ncbi:MAG TPA: AsmA family protein [Solimonas sp.]
MSSKPLHRRRGFQILGVVVLAIVALVLLFDWNWFKGPIARQVSAMTGRSFSIDGDLHVKLGRITKIRADGLRFGNADWADDVEMATLDRLQLDIALRPLLRGDIELPHVHLQRPRVRLERNAEDQANWQLDLPAPASDEPSAPPRIGLLTIDDGELRVHEPSLQTELNLAIHSGERGADGTPPPLIAKGTGRYRAQPFSLQAKIDSPLTLQQENPQFHLELVAAAGATRARVEGALQSPLQLRDFDLDFALSGNDLADLYPLLGIALPPTPPYALRGRAGRDGAAWHYRDFSGHVGDSDLAGRVSVDITGERPKLVATLHSKQLDLDDLAGFIGAPPSTGADETASAEQRRMAAAQQARNRVLPDEPYDLSKLRAMDADVHLRVAALNAPGWPLDSMDARLKLDDGLLHLDPLSVGVAGGSLRTTLTLDARQDPIAVEVDARARSLDLPKLVPGAAVMKDAVGRIGGSASLRTRGNSVAQMLGQADGDIGLAMGAGRISALLVELAGLDIAEGLRYLIGRDRNIALRCAYADFGVAGGVMQTRAFALDTSDTVLHGEGKIDLGQETLALRLIPQPKDMSPVSLRTPLKIGGTFKSPKIRPEAGPLVLRAAAATGLFLIAPPAAVLALIETGPGRNVDCRSPS